MEKWKVIEGFENYQVSNLGNVKGRRGLLKPYYNRDGYTRVSLHNNGKRKVASVHRLVAIAFIPNPEKKEQVNHIDGKRDNNKVDNLEWSTNGENQKHAYRVLNKKKDERAGKPKKKVAQILDGKTVAEFESAHEAARQTGSDYSKIAMVCRGERKSHNGYQWKYLEVI